MLKTTAHHKKNLKDAVHIIAPGNAHFSYFQHGIPDLVHTQAAVSQIRIRVLLTLNMLLVQIAERNPKLILNSRLRIYRPRHATKGYYVIFFRFKIFAIFR